MATFNPHAYRLAISEYSFWLAHNVIDIFDAKKHKMTHTSVRAALLIHNIQQHLGNIVRYNPRPFYVCYR